MSFVFFLAVIILPYAFIAFIIIIIRKSYKKSYQNDQIGTSPVNIEKPREKWPFIKKNSLLTKTEGRFYSVLKEILQNDYLLFSKVKIGDDILYLPDYSYQREANRNRVKSRHVDFLVCDNYTRPLLAIELDDYTHNWSSRVERDNFIDEVFEDAGLPILHVPVSHDYDKVDLLNMIKAKIA
jgi:hypothetical protein